MGAIFKGCIWAGIFIKQIPMVSWELLFVMFSFFLFYLLYQLSHLSFRKREVDVTSKSEKLIPVFVLLVFY